MADNNENASMVNQVDGPSASTESAEAQEPMPEQRALSETPQETQPFVQQETQPIAQANAQPLAQAGTQPLAQTTQPLVQQDAQPLAQQSYSSDDAEAFAALEQMHERRKKKKRKRLITIAIICGVILLIIGSCVAAGIAALPKAMENYKVETVPVERGSITSTVTATGNLRAGSQVAVTPEVSGIIEEVMVVEGQHVEAGDVLFTLKNTDLEKALEEAKANVDRAARALDDANAGVSQAADAYNNAANAYNDAVERYDGEVTQAKEAADNAYWATYNEAIAAIPKTASKSEREQLVEQAREKAEAAATAAGMVMDVNPGSFDGTTYQSSIDAAQSAANSAADALTEARRAYDYALQEADKRTVRAAASGTVQALTAVPGAAVGGATGGTSTASGPLAQIADLSTLCVDAQVNEIDVVNVVSGQQVEVTFTALPDLTLNGTVQSVASVASNATGTGSEQAAGGGVVTYKVTTVINQPDERLRPGMTANTKIVTKELTDVLVVPNAAVTEEGLTAYVSVPVGDSGFETEQREVVVAGRTTSQVAIASGLEEGELVVVSNPLADLASSSSKSGA